MKAKDATRLQILRLMWNGVRKKEIDERKDLNDAEVEKTLLTQIKQINETLEQAKTAGRPEAVAEAENELRVLKEFLPEALPEAEVQKIVQGLFEKMKDSLPAGNAGMGALMKAAMAEVGSRSEGKVIQGAVRKALGMG